MTEDEGKLYPQGYADGQQRYEPSLTAIRVEVVEQLARRTGWKYKGAFRERFEASDHEPRG